MLHRRRRKVHQDFGKNGCKNESFEMSRYTICNCKNNIKIHLHNTNYWNAQFYKFISKFCRLLHVSNLAGSSSGRQLYMQYGMFYSWWIGQCVRDWTHCPIHHTDHTDACKNTPYSTHSCFHEDEPMSFETCRRHNKLNINLENCAFRWFVLCNYITMHGAKKIKLK